MEKETLTKKYILCVRPDFMGDVLMTTPAFRALKETYPDVHLTLLTSSSGGAIARFIPEIDDIIAVDLPWEKTAIPMDNKALLQSIDLLGKKKFDRAIIFTTFSQNALLSALLCYLANIPKRLAYSCTKPYALLTDWVKDNEPERGIRHEVERQLALVEAIGATTSDTRLSLDIPFEARESVLKILAAKHISLQKPFIILHPGASSLKRQYSSVGFAEIAARLYHLGYQVICTGSKEEKDLVQLIREYTKNAVYSLAGELSLAELIALISLSPLLISNNTGPVHIAAAIGTPVIDLYALTNPQHTPWKVASKVLYFEVQQELQQEVVNSTIPKNAMRLHSPEQVVNEALKLLNTERTVSYHLDP